MPTYRAYRLDRARHIRSGEWIQAPNDNLAREQAEELCEEGAPAIELWQAARKVDEIDCEDED
jgi:hypothetical protein